MGTDSDRWVRNEADSGSDCGWVDYLQNAGWQPPPPTDALAQAVDSDLAYTRDGDALWFSESTTYYYGGKGKRGQGGKGVRLWI